MILANHDLGTLSDDTTIRSGSASSIRELTPTECGSVAGGLKGDCTYWENGNGRGWHDPIGGVSYHEVFRYA